MLTGEGELSQKHISKLAQHFSLNPATLLRGQAHLTAPNGKPAP